MTTTPTPIDQASQAQVEWVAREMLEAIVPLTVAEFGMLQSALTAIDNERLVATGQLSAAEVDEMSSLVDDFFAFQAAARTA
jgi:hypothetical protein